MFFDLPQRFETKIIPEPNSGCWLWLGALDGKGYGRAKIAKTRKNAAVHRIVYELVFGPIAAELVLDHKCRVRSCCNPEHLEPTTNKENILRGTSPSAVNAVRAICASGHSLHDAYTVKGWRKCRTCQLANMASYYRRKKANAS
jgi:HNH endonuclease